MSEAEALFPSFMRRAIALADEAVAEGNHPFGAVLVQDGEIVLEAKNSVHSDRDCTCHAERNLVSMACRAERSFERATLVTSVEPCAMCAAAIYWCGFVDTVVYGLPEQALGRITAASEDAVTRSIHLDVPCRDVFARAMPRLGAEKGTPPVRVVGPVLADEVAPQHERFW